MVDFLQPKAYLVESDDLLEPWITLTPETKQRRNRQQLNTRMIVLVISALAVVLVPVTSYNLLSSRAATALLATAEQGSAAASVTFALPQTKTTAPAPELLGQKGAVGETAPMPVVTTADANAVVRIDKIGVLMPIVEGQGENALWKGAWRFPSGSTPERAGNTVLFGHRFLNLPPSKETFFRLDELVVGDTIEVDWRGHTYTYAITGTSVVDPNELSVLGQTHQPTLTLITCTPKFTTKQRLVVHATQI